MGYCDWLLFNPHLHGVFLDGVYELGPEGVPVFRTLSRLSTTDAADVLQIARARILRFLGRRGVVDVQAEATELADELAEREPVLAQLAAAAVSGLSPAGPEVRRRPIEIPLRGKPGVVVTAARCVEEMGFTLHANTCAGALDERGREALLEYVLRPPIANDDPGKSPTGENLQEGPEGLVRIVLKKPFKDATTAIDLDPLSLLCRLASTVPPPGLHTVRYAGVLSSASKLGSRGGGAKRSRGPRDCSLVIPPPPAPDGGLDDHPCKSSMGEGRPRDGKRSRYWRWAELLRRKLGLDPQICDRCGGRMKLVSLVTDPDSIDRYLRHIGEPTEPPRLSPARGPPYYQSRVLRRRPSPQQAQMFDS